LANKRSKAKASRKTASAVKRARSQAARKGWVTRTRNLAEARVQSIRSQATGRGELRDLTRRWSDALTRARDTNTRKAWQNFRRLDAARQGALAAAQGKKKWKRMLKQIEEDVYDLFDIDADNYDATET
jgi:DNA-binding MarR family transcriptional regulator